MVALYKISTNTVIMNYGVNIPIVMEVPGIGNVHAPSSNWAYGDYKLIPVSYVDNPNYPEWSIATQIIEEVKLVDNVLTLVITTQFADPPLINVQSKLCTDIDIQAENIRGKYISTAAPGQLSVYLLRFMEASKLKDDPNPKDADYPIHAAVAKHPKLGTLKKALDNTMAQYEQWVTIAASIEDIRLAAKDNILAANTINDAFLVANAVNWGAL